jgi:hypothetical protein
MLRRLIPDIRRQKQHNLTFIVPSLTSQRIEFRRPMRSDKVRITNVDEFQ